MGWLNSIVCPFLKLFFFFQNEACYQHVRIDFELLKLNKKKSDFSKNVFSLIPDDKIIKCNFLQLLHIESLELRNVSVFNKPEASFLFQNIEKLSICYRDRSALEYIVNPMVTSGIDLAKLSFLELSGFNEIMILERFSEQFAKFPNLKKIVLRVNI